MFQDAPSMGRHLHMMEEACDFLLSLPFCFFFWESKTCLSSMDIKHHSPCDSPRSQSHVLSSPGTITKLHPPNVCRVRQCSRNSPYLSTSLKLHLGLQQDALIIIFKAGAAYAHAIPRTGTPAQGKEATEQPGSQRLLLSFSPEAATCTPCLKSFAPEIKR